MSFFRASNDLNKMGTQNGVFLSKGTSKLEMSETGSETEFSELMGGVTREFFELSSAVVSKSEGILSSSIRKESLTFCLFISSSEFVEDRFRFLDKGEEDVCSEETEGPIIESFRGFPRVLLTSDEHKFSEVSGGVSIFSEELAFSPVDPDLLKIFESILGLRKIGIITRKMKCKIEIHNLHKL